MGKREQWESLLSDWEKSGLSQSEYCRRHSLVKSRFTYWLRQLRSKKRVVGESSFVQVSPSSASIELVVGRVKLSLPLETKSERIAELVKCLS